MSYKITKQEQDNVLKLDPKKRYNHFIAKVADWEELWSLKNDEGFVGMGDDSDNNGIPFWPHPDYARLFITNDWSDCKLEKIDLNDFMEKWLPGMENDKLIVIVFPSPNLKGITVKPFELLSDLKEECKKYE